MGTYILNCMIEIFGEQHVKHLCDRCGLNELDYPVPSSGICSLEVNGWLVELYPQDANPADKDIKNGFS
jgi:hypothetical protein